MTEPKPGHSSPWLRVVSAGREGAEEILVLVPGAGAGLGSFQALLEQDTPHPILAVLLPGRENRIDETWTTDFASAAAEVASEIHRFAHAAGRRPLLIGHSLGATFAYAIASELERSSNCPPAGLIAAAARPPETLLEVHDEERLALLNAGLEARVSAQMGSVLASALRVYAEPIIAADLRWASSFEDDGVVLSCPITAIVGDADPWVAVREACSWERRTSNRFTLVRLRGDHYVLQAHADSLAHLLSEAVAAYDQN